MAIEQTAIILDYNSLAYRQAFATAHLHRLRMDIFEKIVGYVKEFRGYGIEGPVLVASEGSDCWRKDIWPAYKADRAARRMKQGLDFEYVHAEMRAVLKAIDEGTPYRHICVAGCEADDIIAVATKVFADQETASIIFSSDCDYTQLRSDRVAQYKLQEGVLVTGTEIQVELGRKSEVLTPEEWLMVAILTGQSKKDNIPSVADDTKPRMGKVAAWNIICQARKNQGSGTLRDAVFAALPESRQRAFLRNETCIDLGKIPSLLVSEIQRELAVKPHEGVDEDVLRDRLGYRGISETRQIAEDILGRVV